MSSSNDQTTLAVFNSTGKPVQVWITLAKGNDYMSKVENIPFVKHVDPNNSAQGHFELEAGKTVTYTSPPGFIFSGNVCFGSMPLNCIPDKSFKFQSGLNLAEFTLNISGGDETIDISGVYGTNAFIKWSIEGGGQWNAGRSHPNVTSFSNRVIGKNIGRIGVFPYGCTDCTNSEGFVPCGIIPSGAPNPIVCQSEPICNVQRNSTGRGGRATIIFNGFIEIEPA